MLVPDSADDDLSWFLYVSCRSDKAIRIAPQFLGFDGVDAALFLVRQTLHRIELEFISMEIIPFVYIIHASDPEG